MTQFGHTLIVSDNMRGRGKKSRRVPVEDGASQNTHMALALSVSSAEAEDRSHPVLLCSFTF